MNFKDRPLNPVFLGLQPTPETFKAIRNLAILKIQLVDAYLAFYFIIGRLDEHQYWYIRNFYINNMEDMLNNINQSVSIEGISNQLIIDYAVLCEQADHIIENMHKLPPDWTYAYREKFGN